MLYGKCICGQRWWWTGDLKTVPSCGNCGRVHSKLDCACGRNTRDADDAREQQRRRRRHD
jgi:hypothetical protein